MINLDVAGLLQTYAYKVAKCEDKETIIKIIKKLKEELNITKLRKELED